MEIGYSTKRTQTQNLQQNRYHPNNCFRPNGPGNFTSKELFNISSHDSEQYECLDIQTLDNYCDYDDGNTQDVTPEDKYFSQHSELNLKNEICALNFQQTASAIPLDT